MVKKTFSLTLLVIACSASQVLAWQKPVDVLFKAADVDRNGAISEAEWHGAMQKRFEAMDANRDGTLSRAEMDAAKETMRERFRRGQDLNG
jgi:Ca2+-binding EF-hand superfamily protein